MSFLPAGKAPPVANGPPLTQPSIAVDAPAPLPSRLLRTTDAVGSLIVTWAGNAGVSVRS